MIETSKELIDNMRGTQTVSARINVLNSPETTIYGYDVTDIEQLLIDNNYVTDAPSYGYKMFKQLDNCITHENGKYAIFEGEGIDLSGVQVLSNKAKNNHMGWYSNILSSEDGTIDTRIGYYFNIDEDINTKFNIVFNKERSEYAVNFDIEITNLYMDYEGERRESRTYEVRDNDKILYTLENIKDFGESTTIMILIHKWSKPKARVKISSLYWGEMLEYTDFEIVNFKTIKELDLLNTSLPSKQIDITVQDMDGDYNIFNPQRRTC